MHRLRYIMLSFTVLCLTFLVASKTSFAQSQLKLGILVESFRENQRKCQLNSEDIKSSISLILKQNGILRDDEVHPYFYVNVGALEIDDINCAVHLRMSLIAYRPTDTHSGFSKKRGLDEVLLCDNGILFAYAKNKISKAIIDEVEILTKRCLSSLDY